MSIHRPLCKSCGIHQVTSNGTGHSGYQKLKSICWSCSQAVRGYKLHKKHSCERCGFVAEHPSQLDVDHIDGNKLNGDPSNLQTLCANCHRLKTAVNGDWHNYDKNPVPESQLALVLESQDMGKYLYP